MRILPSLIAAASLAAITDAQTPDWGEQFPNPDPTARAGLQGASDGNKLYFFGGNKSPVDPYFTDLMSYDGTNWTVEAAAGTGPSGRVNYGLTWDSARNVLVFFGGADKVLGDQGDTWEWSSATGWQQVALTGLKPEPRRWTQLDYFPGLGAVLHGGKNQNAGFVYNDTWAWDGATWTPLVDGPYARQRGRMVYRGAPHNDLLYYGGRDASEVILNETWSFDGNLWTQIPTTSSPGGATGLFAFGMYYDPLADKVVTFGGTQGGVEKDWTFEFDGTDWTEVFPETVPGQRTGHAISWIASASEAYMFGGFSGGQKDDTWTRGTGFVGPMTLTGSPSSVSLSAGGTQVLGMDVDNSFAGKTYFVIGSATGTSPGIALDGFIVPLNFDAYLTITVTNPGALLFGSIGALDAQGQGAIAFNLPAGTDPSLAGLQLNHAGVVLDFSAGFIQLLEVTNAVSVDLVP